VLRLHVHDVGIMYEDFDLLMFHLIQYKEMIVAYRQVPLNISRRAN
jgi:hypothetical protein